MELVVGKDFPPYEKTIRKLKTKYRNIESDLDGLFERIGKDPEKAANPIVLPQTQGLLRYYRCKSSDQQKGSQGGFRIICYCSWSSSRVLIIPALIYAKSQQEGRPGEQSIKAIVCQLKEHLIEEHSNGG